MRPSNSGGVATNARIHLRSWDAIARDLAGRRPIGIGLNDGVLVIYGRCFSTVEGWGLTRAEKTDAMADICFSPDEARELEALGFVMTGDDEASPQHRRAWWLACYCQRFKT